MMLTFQLLTQVDQKPPLSPIKIQKPTEIPIIIESDEEDMSPVLDLASRKRKQQSKVTDTFSQPPAKLPKKRPSALTIQEPTPEEMAKIATAKSESDNSSPGVEGEKVKQTSLYLT